LYIIGASISYTLETDGGEDETDARHAETNSFVSVSTRVKKKGLGSELPRPPDGGSNIRTVIGNRFKAPGTREIAVVFEIEEEEVELSV
jgi:hypothetical protein